MVREDFKGIRREIITFDAANEFLHELAVAQFIEERVQVVGNGHHLPDPQVVVIGHFAQGGQMAQINEFREIPEREYGTAYSLIDDVQAQFVLVAHLRSLVMVDDKVRLVHGVYQLYHVVIGAEVREDDCLVGEAGDCVACRVIVAGAGIVGLDRNRVRKHVLDNDAGDCPIQVGMGQVEYDGFLFARFVQAECFNDIHINPLPGQKLTHL